MIRIEHQRDVDKDSTSSFDWHPNKGAFPFDWILRCMPVFPMEMAIGIALLYNTSFLHKPFTELLICIAILSSL